MTLTGLPAEDMSATHGVDKGGRMHAVNIVEADPWRSEQERSRFLWYLMSIPMNIIAFFAWMRTRRYLKGKKFTSLQERNESVPWTSSVLDRWSKTARQIRIGAASFKALDSIYHMRMVDTEAWRQAFARIWYNMRNAKAVRNRFRLTRIELLRAVREIAPTIDGPVNVFSIASGSAEAVLDVIKVVQKEGIEIRVFLLDKDPHALDYSMNQACVAGLEHLITTIEDDIRSLEVIVDDLPDIHIVEMVGFLDYKKYDKGVQLFRRIKAIIQSGGVFITAQIAPNLEVPFFFTVLQWPMIYRTRKQFYKMFIEAGFLSKNTRVFPEAQSIHNIGVAWKEE